ncbi:alpha/beta hydrolase [Streptomyces lichenis]|uniref:Acyl-CoA:diacylglycerol acyltransferase n=1 Tax=Streptomyces lichenis TaxID=2306967 RepID=A0ABT0IFL4_9ACTN|nr:alpha/beta hydrolase-fold protein [Streptomyces lichenis]MCK8680099.1 alpha/beta hydrolase-fold protein [Streptomyces lichenis]
MSALPSGPGRRLLLHGALVLGAGAVGAGQAAALPRAAAGGGAEVIAETFSGRRIVDLVVESAALGRPAGVRLLTPEDWHARRPVHRWPVLLLLPGGDGDHLAWTRDYGIHGLSALRHTLVVMPEMPLFGFCTDWWNHGEGGPPAVETFHLREVLPLVERHYGAGTRRVVAGQSQGGFGAVSYTARHRGLFRAPASYSGFVHPLQHPRAVRAAMDHLGLEWTALWGDPVRQRAIWQAHDPAYLAHRLSGIPVRLSCGDGRLGPLDPPGTLPDEHIPGLEDPDAPFPADVLSPTEWIMREENEALAPVLRAAGARVTTRFHAGTHDPAYWSREFTASLPMLLRALR